MPGAAPAESREGEAARPFRVPTRVLDPTVIGNARAVDALTGREAIEVIAAAL